MLSPTIQGNVVFLKLNKPFEIDFKNIFIIPFIKGTFLGLFLNFNSGNAIFFTFAQPSYTIKSFVAETAASCSLEQRPPLPGDQPGNFLK